MLKNKQSQRGFTLVELMVVIVIIAILAALVIPAGGTQFKVRTALVRMLPTTGNMGVAGYRLGVVPGGFILSDSNSTLLSVVCADTDSTNSECTATT